MAACGEAKQSSGSHSSVSDLISRDDTHDYQDDLTESGPVRADSDQTNNEKISNNELTEPKEVCPKDSPAMCVDQSEDTEDVLVTECVDPVLVINKHLCHVRQGGESQHVIKAVSEQHKQGADLIFTSKITGDSMADSVTGKSEADSLSQVIYCLILQKLCKDFTIYISPLCCPRTRL